MVLVVLLRTVLVMPLGLVEDKYRILFLKITSQVLVVVDKTKG